MRLALSNESPPRLLVVCKDAGEHERITAHVKLLKTRTTQSAIVAELLGITTEPFKERIAGLTRDIGLTGLRVGLEDLTGQEEIFSTEPEKVVLLRKAAALAVEVLGEEPVIDSGITAGLHSANVKKVPRRDPYYRGIAARALEQTVADLDVSLLQDIPRGVSVTYPASHPLAQAPPTSGQV